MSYCKVCGVELAYGTACRRHTISNHARKPIETEEEYLEKMGELI